MTKKKPAKKKTAKRKIASEGVTSPADDWTISVQLASGVLFACDNKTHEPLPIKTVGIKRTEQLIEDLRQVHGLVFTDKSLSEDQVYVRFVPPTKKKPRSKSSPNTGYPKTGGAHIAIYHTDVLKDFDTRPLKEMIQIIAYHTVKVPREGHIIHPKMSQGDIH